MAVARKRSLFELKRSVRAEYTIGAPIVRKKTHVIYTAKKVEGGIRYAVKAISKRHIQNVDDMRLAVINEVNICRLLDHPNILKVYDAFEDDESFYLIMEYLPHSRELLEKVIENYAYSERDAFGIVKQLLEAVAYLHSKRIVHRDIRPDNILVCGDGRLTPEKIKLTHFQNAVALSTLNSGKLQECIGTPEYVAPEALVQDMYDGAPADMWSVGVTAYAILSGFLPWENGEDKEEMYKQIVNASYDFDDAVWDTSSNTVQEFIGKLLVRDPERRSTAEQALQHTWIHQRELAELLVSSPSL